MLLTKQEQDIFFDNYISLLYYASVYEGLLPEGSSITDFVRSPIVVKVQSRDVLFTEPDIPRRFRMDNGKNMPEGGDAFLVNVGKGILGDFVVLKEYKGYTVLQDVQDGKFYHVSCITQPLSELISFIPNYITTAIFNFNGKIICDGLIKGGNIRIGPNNKNALLEEYRARKAAKEIVTLL